jgi:hypothetical protein
MDMFSILEKKFNSQDQASVVLSDNGPVVSPDQPKHGVECFTTPANYK